MKYRHELKFIISKSQAEILKHRLSLIMDVDSNSINLDNTYYIRSLYFDDLKGTAYYEKLDGVEFRKKYRIRFYNLDPSFVRLECKYKHNNMTSKDHVKLTSEQVKNILNGNIDIKSDNNLLNMFLTDIRTKELRPSVIVDYTRLAYTYHVSEVRVTFDSNVKSGAFHYDLFDSNIPTTSMIDDNEVVLEVKFNEILPESIAIILSTVPMFRQAFSKFAICRSIK